MFDVIVRGGLLLDGTGAEAQRADIGIQGDRITAIGQLDLAEAAQQIDASGRYVTPGLIDAHVHGDGCVFDRAVQRAALRQGITTFVLGQDGLSYAPGSPATVAYVSRYFAAVNGPHPTFGDGPVSVAGLLDSYSGVTALNTAYLAPHGTIRYEVMGAAERPATDTELSAMRRLVERALDEGAVGLSSGLEYAPGRYADVRELADLCRPAAARGLPYVTHMRGYEADAPRGVAEVREIARASGAAAHISHYHGPAEQLIALVDDSRAEGIDLTFDSYPYLRGSTILAMVVLPPWLPTADPERTVAALADDDTLSRLDTEWFGPRAEVWPRITLSHVPSEQWRWAEGRTLPTVAEKVGLSPAETCVALLRATDLQVGCVFGQPPTNSAESVRALLRHPAQMGSSDGIYMGGHPHPRGWGAFARVLGRHVRELGDLSWPDAVVHLSAHPARRFGFRGRGLLRVGGVADLAVIDPARVADVATYEEPKRCAVGVDDVVVNGRPVLAGGELTGEKPGRPLRGSS
ncbi:MAG: amidohydrolase family protein [Actinocatenispora sp.]